MKRIGAFTALLLCLSVAGLLTAVALATTNEKPPSPPGQGPCEHGNATKPCKEDPQPDHGKECDEHGNHGGVNEDHCKANTTTTTTTTTGTTETTHTTTTGTTTTETTTTETTTTTNPSTTSTTTTTEPPVTTTEPEGTTTTSSTTVTETTEQPTTNKPRKHTKTCPAPAYLKNGTCVRDFKGKPHPVQRGQG